MLLDMSCLNFYNLTENVITFYFLPVSQYEDLEREGTNLGKCFSHSFSNECTEQFGIHSMI